MSITNITNATGFDPRTYANLLEEARAQGIGAPQVDNLLLEAINNGGQNFNQAVNQVSQNLPRLAPPNGADLSRIAEFGVAPSPGALVMSLVTKYVAEQREQNREIRHQMTEQIVASMQDEADKMREMAAIQLAMGIVSGALTIAGGAVQTGMSAAALKTPAIPKGQADTPATPSASNNGQSLNFMGQGMSQGMSGAAGIAKAIGDYYATRFQAEMKEMQADQERMREMRDSVKDLDEGLKELIQKTLAAQDSIQQAQNQARAKILG
ncbi:MAG: type III secretion system translocon subunit SctB [Zoogloeaceae bacterium]|jgi:hypothetical protein|nr:type III secretion system translocon subunit SctB [Zoogloeaceae bacterium]